MLWHEPGPREAGHIRESDLKICDLCGALNLEDNRECFVCGWRGRFERRREVIRMAMELFERRHGRLEIRWLTSGSLYRQIMARTRNGTLVRLLGRARHWLFG